MNYGSAVESSPEPGRFGDFGTQYPGQTDQGRTDGAVNRQAVDRVLHVAAEWALIAATIYLCQRFWHPMLYVFAVAFIGSRQHALLVLMHDGVHYRLLRNRRLNDWLSEVVLAWPHLVSARQVSQEPFCASSVSEYGAGSRLEAQGGRPGVGISAGGADSREDAVPRRGRIERPGDAQAGGVGGDGGRGADVVPRAALRILRGGAGGHHLLRERSRVSCCTGSCRCSRGWC